MAHRLVPASLALAAVTGLMGCGGSNEDPTPTRSVSGSIEWPESTGPVTGIRIGVWELRTGQGAVLEIRSISSSVSGDTYQAAGLPVGVPVLVGAEGASAGGGRVRLAGVLPSLGRANAATTTIHLTPASTIAAKAVERLLVSGQALGTVTAGMVANLETAAQGLAGSTDLTAGESLSAAAQRVLSETHGGTAPAPGSATVIAQ